MKIVLFISSLKYILFPEFYNFSFSIAVWYAIAWIYLINFNLYFEITCFLVWICFWQALLWANLYICLCVCVCIPPIDSYKLIYLGQSIRKCMRLLIKIAKLLSKPLIWLSFLQVVYESACWTTPRETPC